MTTAGAPEKSAAAADGPPLSAVLFQMTTGTMVSQAVSVAARLGVADVLADGPRSVEEIAELVDADPSTLYRLLRAVADLGLFTELDDRHFELAPLGVLLRDEVEGSLRGWATMVGMPFARDSWTDLYTSVKTGEPAFQRVHGEDLFSYLAKHPDDAAIFNEAMRFVSTAVLTGLLEAYDFSRFPTIVDVGGGTGALLAAILQANPETRGVLADRPDVLSSAAPVLTAAAITDRVETVASDFFQAVPEAGDLYVLSNIIHDWGDEDAVRILQACRQAMPDDGRLLIVELVLPDGGEPSMAKLADLEMLALTPGGRQRTISEYAGLLEQAGLRLTDAVAATSGRSASYVEALPEA
jgi:DNA-binding transcriptional ArsR family regulator